MKSPVSTTIAIAFGLMVLIAYFVNLPVLNELQTMLLSWAMILAAVALFVGTFHLLLVHVLKIKNKQKNSFYSVIVIISLLIALVIGLWFGPENDLTVWLFTSVQLPIEKSLMALLVITLIYASIRLLRKRTNIFSVIFLLSGLLILLCTAPLPFGEIPIIGDLLRPIIMKIPATAGARGILLGVALGTLTTGLRILLGADRPYGNK